MRSFRLRLLFVLALSGLPGLVACGPSGPSVMEFVEIDPTQPRIGDVVTVRFKLLDSRGLPLAGQAVDFKLQSETTAASQSVSLSPVSVQSLKGSGFAETQLVASSRVNSVIVVATSGDKVVTSPPITFAGSVPNGRQFTFQCGPVAGSASGGRHAIGAYSETRNMIAGVKLDCTAHTGDRNGDGVPSALVSFLTEAGTIGPTETSKTDVIGNATILYKTSLPLPTEVAPDTFTWTPPVDDSHTGEYLAPLWMHPYEWVENPLTFAATGPSSRVYTLREPRRTDPIRFRPDGSGRYENNPRDNLVTMIAITAGEEGFTDSNNNGRYDPPELFDDLPEPFVDANDNGTWDPEERFIDVDGDHNWTPKNGKWDASTLIWTQERILWTGLPTLEDQLLVVPGVANHRPVTATIQPASVTLRCPPGIAVGQACYQAQDSVTGAAVVVVTTFLADPWFNSLARNSDGDGCVIGVSGKAPVELKSSTVSGQAFTYAAGEVLQFGVGDARDPNLPPISQVPRRAVEIPFSLPIVCSYTATDKDGYVSKIIVGTINGTID